MPCALSQNDGPPKEARETAVAIVSAAAKAKAGDTDSKREHEALRTFISSSPVHATHPAARIRRSLEHWVANEHLRRLQRARYRQTGYIPCWLGLTTLVPSTYITKISWPASRSLSKAMRLPSDDHVGSHSLARESVRDCRRSFT